MTKMVIRGGYAGTRLRNAKAKLSAVVDNACNGVSSIIMRHGKPAVVVLGISEWERLSRVPSFARLLMAVPIEPSGLPR